MEELWNAKITGGDGEQLAFSALALLLCSPSAGLLTLHTLMLCSTERSYGSCTWQENSLLLKLFWGQQKVTEAPSFSPLKSTIKRFRAKWVRWCVSAQLRWLWWPRRDTQPLRAWCSGLGGSGIFKKQLRVSHQLRQSCVMLLKGGRAKLGSCCCCGGRRNWKGGWRQRDRARR